MPVKPILRGNTTHFAKKIRENEGGKLFKGGGGE